MINKDNISIELFMAKKENMILISLEKYLCRSANCVIDGSDNSTVTFKFIQISKVAGSVKMLFCDNMKTFLY